MPDAFVRAAFEAVKVVRTDKIIVMVDFFVVMIIAGSGGVFVVMIVVVIILVVGHSVGRYECDRVAGVMVDHAQQLVRVVQVAAGVAVRVVELHDQVRVDDLGDAEQHVGNRLAVTGDLVGGVRTVVVFAFFDDAEQCRKRDGRAADWMPVIPGERHRGAKRRIAPVEVPGYGEVHAAVLVVVFAGEAETGADSIESAERLAPACADGGARVEKRGIQRNFTRGRRVHVEPGRAGKGLGHIQRRGAAGCSAGQRVDGQVQREVTFVVEVARGQCGQACIVDPVIALPVVEQGGFQRPARVVLAGGRLRGRAAQQDARGGHQFAIDFSRLAHGCLTMSALVAAAPAAGKAAAAAGGLLAEVDVIVQRIVDGFAVQQHFLSGEDVPFPWLDAEIGARGEG